MQPRIRIGTRDSQLAVWQATLVQGLLEAQGLPTEIVAMKSEGDTDTITPLYAMGVTGVFTKTLDAALLNKRVDIAVHSMKDVPTQLAQGIRQAAVLPRASSKDILLYKNNIDLERIGYSNGEWSAAFDPNFPFTVATGSVRRIAQWFNRYPSHRIENLRGNVNTRLQKLEQNDWNGAIFAAAGLERINLRPANSIDLDWMLPAPAQGTIMVVCREGDTYAATACSQLNDDITAICTKIERDFLSALMGGCSTPISGLAQHRDGKIYFEGNIVTPDGGQKAEVKQVAAMNNADKLGFDAAREILENGGKPLVDRILKKGLGNI